MANMSLALVYIAYAKVNWAPHGKEKVQIEAISNHSFRPSLPEMTQTGNILFTVLTLR